MNIDDLVVYSCIVYIFSCRTTTLGLAAISLSGAAIFSNYSIERVGSDSGGRQLLDSFSRSGGKIHI